MGRQGIGVVPHASLPVTPIQVLLWLYDSWSLPKLPGGVQKTHTSSKKKKKLKTVFEFAKTVQGPEHVMEDPVIAPSFPVLSSLIKNNGS